MSGADFPAREVELDYLTHFVADPGGLRKAFGHHDLTTRGRLLQPRSGVDDIADGGEVGRAGSVVADEAYEGRTNIETDSDLNEGSRVA